MGHVIHIGVYAVAVSPLLAFTHEEEQNLHLRWQLSQQSDRAETESAADGSSAPEAV